MRKTIAVLLAALTANCGDCDDMGTKDWEERKRRNAESQATNGQWADVGAEWDAQRRVTSNPKAGAELGDELKWGNIISSHFTVNGQGVYTQPMKQIITATRPARVWTIQVTMTMQGGSTPTGGNALVGNFAIEIGVGQSKILQYVQLTHLDFRQPFGGAGIFPPVASAILTNIPARDIIITGQVGWVNGANNFDDGAKVVNLNAAVSPIYR